MKLTLTGMELTLTGMELTLTGVQLTLTGVQLTLTGVQLFFYQSSYWVFGPVGTEDIIICNITSGNCW